MLKYIRNMQIAPYYKRLLQNIKEQINRSHSKSYIGMFDSGKNYMFRLLVTEDLNLKDTLFIPLDLSSGDIIKAFQTGSSLIRSSVEIENLDQMWEEISSRSKQRSVVLAFNLPYGGEQDLTFFTTLYSWKNLLRDKLNWIIFANYGIFNCKVSDRSAFDKVVLSNVTPILPLDKKSSEIVIDNYNKYFGPIEKSKRKKIIELSGGNPGFLKSLYLLAQQKRLDLWEHDEQLQVRIKKLFDELSPKELSTLANLEEQGKKETKNFKQLEKFGYIYHERLFSPILDKFISRYYTSNTNMFSSTQLKVFNLLREKYPQIVSRDEIGRTMWGARWTQEYSDWALDRMIHEIRNKLKKSSNEWFLKTKRDLGYFLTKNRD
ncbi:hypothetical protein A3G65_04575 [Candidatus Roizmanbacteria bacterium RIFCSPLOWO2_12_FULL_37_7b]|nr:MAG: hypothetical protein A3G65_04575 [Candidatus Roizmanbacteria bacterium RIFCSPLOWO2_12_FULL_37_7b]